MKKLHLLVTAAAMLAAISGPSLAASRAQATGAADAYSAYAQDIGGRRERVRPAPYAAVPVAPSDSQYGAQDNIGSPYGVGNNLPYPDRAYGDPDRD